jgi:methyl-accepting chemotaxis protein
MIDKIQSLIQEQKLSVQETREQLNQVASLLDVKNKLSLKERAELENTINELEQEVSLRFGFLSDLESLL